MAEGSTTRARRSGLPSSSVRLRRWGAAVLLLAVVGLALGIRLYGIDWDRGALLHPDERFLTMVVDDMSAPASVGEYFDTDASPMNPALHSNWYVYGTLPTFTAKGVSTWLHHGVSTGAQPAAAIVEVLDASGVPLLDEAGRPRFDGEGRSHLIGRLLAALADASTTLAVFLLGRSVAGRRAGLLGALVWAVSVLPVQQAHFFVADPFLTAAVAWTLVLAAQVARGAGHDRRWWAAVVGSGVLVGVAAACKVNGVLVGLVLVAAIAMARTDPSRDRGAPTSERIGWDPRRWAIRDLVRVLAVPTLVAATAAAIVFRVAQPYAFDGWLSLSDRWLADLSQIRDIHGGSYTPSSVQWAGRIPYLEPLGHLVRFGFGVPATLLALYGAWQLRPRLRWRGEPTVPLLVGWLALWLVLLPRFMPYMRYFLPVFPVLAVLAGCGAARLVEGARLRKVVGLSLVAASVLWCLAFVNGVHRAEDPRLVASQWLIDNVEEGAVLSHQEWDDGLPVWSEEAVAKGFSHETLRPYDLIDPASVRHLAEQLDRVDYVVESSDRLTASVGRLPGRHAAAVRYYQALGDGSLGFERVATFRAAPELFGLTISDDGSEESFRVYDHPPVDIWRKTDAFSVVDALVVLQPERTRTQVPVPLTAAAANGGLLRDHPPAELGDTFDQVFHDRLPIPWLWWLVWWQVVSVSSLGWVSRLLRSLPDRGIALAQVLGPMAVVVPLWSLVAWGLVPLSALSAASATALAVLAGVMPRRSRDSLVGLWRTHRRVLAGVVGLAVASFLAALVLRSANPDLWYEFSGGEKPFETAYFTSVARSSWFPALDPWFSGGSMNYYAGSWFVLAVPTRLLGIPPEVALNLGLATVVSMTVSAAWAVGTALFGLKRSEAAPVPEVGSRSGRGGDGGGVAWWPGLVSVGAVLLLGNLASARQQLLRAFDAVRGRDVSSFDWWAVSRLNPSTSDINEFPAWAVLFGDAHPHLLSMPILVTVIGLLVGYIATRMDPRSSSRRAGLLAIAVGGGLAWTRVSHTWDLPTLSLLAGMAVVLGALVDPRSGRRARWRRSAVDAGFVAIVAVVVSRPHVRAIEVFDGGLVGSPAVTPIGSYLLQYGPFLVVLVLVSATWVWVRRSDPSKAAPSDQGLVAGGLVAVAGVAVGLFGWRGPVLALAGLAVVLALALAVHALRSGTVGMGLAAGLVAAGIGLSAVAEVVVVRNDIGRANTVFKFGFTAWVLMALGGAALGAWALSTLDRRRWLTVGLTLAVLPGLVFWPSATSPRLSARFQVLPLTLDGRAWLDHGPVVVGSNGIPPIDVTEDEPLIDWLRAHGRHGETVVEAVGPSYSWVGRISVATGLPTVLGWQYHQEQQRRPYVAAIGDRARSVTALYADPDPEQALRTLAAFRPNYVVVGTVERVLGTDAALLSLSDQPALSEAFRHEALVIYRVDLDHVDRQLASIDLDPEPDPSP